jgi:uncharacterized protein YbjT (DUF2867 family)
MTMVVVFGGGGFLGQRLVGRLTAEGMSVRVRYGIPTPRGLSYERSVSIW